MPDYGMQLDVTYTPPFGGGSLSGLGKWFKTDEGFVWTDNKDHLNLLDFDNYQASQGFLDLKYAFAASGKNAEQTFDSLADTAIQEDDTVRVISGNLESLKKEYEDIVAAPLVAAGNPTDSYGVTVDKDGESILELVKSNDDGTFVRSNKTWTAIDPEENNPTVFDTTWYEVSDQAVPIFDDNEDKEMTKDHFNRVMI